VSVHVASWVWDNSPYSGAALLIHLSLADYANDEGICWPSQVTLAKRCRCSERYVRDAIKRMISDGLLVIEAPSNGHGSHLYRVVFQSSRPRNSATSPRNHASGHPGNPLPKNRHRTTKEPEVCPVCSHPPGLHSWCAISSETENR
jgi:DNA-binding FadR family transcriptional regulator